MDFSTENLDITSDTPSSYNPEEDSTFVLANSDVQISDNYLPESAYISEIEASEWQPENNYEDMPEGVVSRATVGDPMVYLTQRWLNQEYGDVPGFGSVPENGRTGWDTIYGLTRALQIELGITSLANNFGPTTARLYGQNPLHRQDGITNKKFAILQGALWCKGYSPGYYLRENADGTVSFDEIFNEMIVNNGYETADGIFKVIDKGEIQEVLSSNNILQLNPGQTVEFTYAIDNSKLEASVSGDPLLLDLKIESETDESNYINNNQDIYIYPDYAIELTSGVGGTVSGDGVYMYNSIATLTATPNPGYIFAGWYENGQLLDNLAAEYSFDVLSNRTLEAVFIPNNLTVTNTEIFGALETTNELIFTINTTGGNQPYQWEVFIYRNDVLCYSDNIIVNFFEWTPTEVGDYSVVINVTDASNFVTSYTKQFTIT